MPQSKPPDRSPTEQMQELLRQGAQQTRERRLAGSPQLDPRPIEPQPEDSRPPEPENPLLDLGLNEVVDKLRSGQPLPRFSRSDPSTSPSMTSRPSRPSSETISPTTSDEA